jgi:rhamnopyranosyl-N-acetylglucosaminyl-diphospho-decaprenol beta-1,3/1,4-galactofuranosyltransferase
VTEPAPVLGVEAVVLTHNRWALLLETLGAMLRLTVRPDRLVVVDNASTDGTPARLREHGWIGDVPPEGGAEEWRWVGEAAGPAGGAGLPILYILRPHNDGGAGGFAAGLREALGGRCDWFWLMDDDVEPAPDSLAMLLADAAGDRRRVIQQRRVYRDGRDVELQAGRLNLGNPFRELMQAPAPFPDEVSAVPVRTFTFEGLLVPRGLVEAVGLPDASFFLFADDTDYAIRAQRAGFTILASARSRIVKKLGQAASAEYTQRHYYYFRNLYRLDLRYGAPAVRLLRPRLLLVRRVLGCLLRRCSRESLAIVWRSYRDARRLEREQRRPAGMRP